jgi:Zn-dependent protease with chaperone function
MPADDDTTPLPTPDQPRRRVPPPVWELDIGVAKDDAPSPIKKRAPRPIRADTSGRTPIAKPPTREVVSGSAAGGKPRGAAAALSPGIGSASGGRRAPARPRPAQGLPEPSQIPQDYPDRVAWFRVGLARQPWATTLALLASYTGVFLALWAAVAGLVLGGLVGAGLIDSNSITRAIAVGTGGSVTIISVVASAVVSAFIAFGVVYVAILVLHGPIQVLITVVGAFLVTVVTVGVISRFEQDLLVLRGYRRPSRDEARQLAPVVQRVGTAMKLSAYPRFCIWDSAVPGAWTHMRHVVITTGLLQALEEDELAAVLAHEMHHWRRGDSVSLRIVWAAALPVAVLYNLGRVMAGRRQQDTPTVQIPNAYRGLMAIVGWAILWPTWVLMKVVIGPATAARGRRYEYEADAAAAQIGLAQPLIEALRQISIFEPARSGWEEVIMASHPPTELRIEALQQPRPDDADFQEGPLGRLLHRI